MRRIPRRSRSWRKALIRRATKTGCTTVLRRAQIVASASAGRSAMETAEGIGCVRSHVYVTLARFEKEGWLGLLDGRRKNGQRKADKFFHAAVADLLRQSPRDYGYLRFTWTRELLARVAEEQTGVRVSLVVMGRVLRALNARRGRPKPVVACTLSERQKRRRLAHIRELLATLPGNEVAVYEDEIDIHLNPKIGLDWMPAGVQRLVMTPGQNEKAYVAGTLDARDGSILWVGAVEKNSNLFIAMMEKLHSHHQSARLIHVILDNYGIHRSDATRQALASLPRIRLHFLPPYCPDHNRIERLWLDLHSSVTRNHKHSCLVDLCTDVAHFLNSCSPWNPVANHSRPPLRLAA